MIFNFSKYLSLIIIALSLQSCIIYNSTKNADDICNIHSKKMHKALVGAKYGRFIPMKSKLKPEYKNAKSPKHMGCVIRGIRKRFAIKFYCKECNKLKRTDKDRKNSDL